MIHTDGKYGLADEDVQNIVKAITAVPTVMGVVLYGSRAMGNYRSGSDIDIVLLGDSISYDDVLQVVALLDDLELLYTFDIQPMNAITNSDLISHIHRNGVVLYSKAK